MSAPNPSGGVSPDLARLREIPGCGALVEDDVIQWEPVDRHDFAMYGAWSYECLNCEALIRAAIRAETLEEAAKACEAEARLWEGDTSPIEYAAEARLCAARVRALTGSQTPNGE